jgi:hypothetical protein
LGNIVWHCCCVNWCSSSSAVVSSLSQETTQPALAPWKLTKWLRRLWRPPRAASGHAALVGGVAVEVDVAFGAASETLLHTARVGTTEARELRDAELPAEPGHELHLGKAVERAERRRLRIGPTGRARACDATKSQSPSAASSGSSLHLPPHTLNLGSSFVVGVLLHVADRGKEIHGSGERQKQHFVCALVAQRSEIESAAGATPARRSAQGQRRGRRARNRPRSRR